MTNQHADFRWKTPPGSEVSLEAIRSFVDSVSKDLDPGSRYVRELRAVLDASSDVADYLSRLQDRERLVSFQQDGSVASHGERGRSWVDDETWTDMDPFEQTLSNLLTGETRMMWAGEGAANYARLSEVLGSFEAPVRALSVPCSTGKEPFSLAIAGLQAGLDLSVVGVDRQEAYLDRARSGTLVPHQRDLQLDGVEAYLVQGSDGRTRISAPLAAVCSFEHGDVLTGKLPPAGSFHLVSCRNLLGYFRDETLVTAWRNVAARLRPGGTLLVDYYVSGADEMAPARDAMTAAGFTRRYPEADYYDAPANWAPQT